jgi:hypothetical protein
MLTAFTAREMTLRRIQEIEEKNKQEEKIKIEKQQRQMLNAILNDIKEAAYNCRFEYYFHKQHFSDFVKSELIRLNYELKELSAEIIVRW